MPAPGQRHGLAFHPHIAIPQRIVAQDVPAVWADLIVVTARDVDDATVDCTSVTVSKPAKHKQFFTCVECKRSPHSSAIKRYSSIKEAESAVTWAVLPRRTSSPQQGSRPPLTTKLRYHSSLPQRSGTLPRSPGRSPLAAGSSGHPAKTRCS